MERLIIKTRNKTTVVSPPTLTPFVSKEKRWETQAKAISSKREEAYGLLLIKNRQK